VFKKLCSDSVVGCPKVLARQEGWQSAKEQSCVPGRRGGSLTFQGGNERKRGDLSFIALMLSHWKIKNCACTQHTAQKRTACRLHKNATP